MEDAHIAQPSVIEEPPLSVFSIFDGHGGGAVATFCSKHLVQELLRTTAFSEGNLALAVRQAYLRLDELLDSDAGHKELVSYAGQKSENKGLFDTVESNAPEHSDDFARSALSRHSLDVSKQELSTSETDSQDSVNSEDEVEEHHKASGMGCTAITALITLDKVIVANTGDSRCVASKRGQAEALSIDHKPILEAEAQRIMKAGGFVRDNRVNGALNVSRTIGDLDFKRNADVERHEQMVIAVPELVELPLDEDIEFIILACDGIWDVLSNQEAVDFVRKRIKSGQSLKEICEAMCDRCLAPDLKGLCKGADNMSVIVVHLKHGDALERGVLGKMMSGMKSWLPRNNR